MKSVYSATEVATLSFHDSELTRIAWERDGEDLVLGIAWCPPRGGPVSVPSEATPVELTARYVTDFDASLKCGAFMGAPPIYGLSVAPMSSDRWRVCVEFLGGPDGELSFECNDLSLVLKAR